MLRPLDRFPGPIKLDATPLPFSTLYWPVGNFMRWRSTVRVHAVYYVFDNVGWRRLSVCRAAPRPVVVADPGVLHRHGWLPFDPLSDDACDRCAARVLAYRERMGIDGRP